MSASSLSAVRLARMRGVLTGHVARDDLPGLVTLVARRGEVHVETIGSMEAGGDGGPMRRDAIFRIASVTKQITAAAAMTLVEECRLRLDDPVDELLPELADRRVLKRPDGPLDDTVPAHRPLTLRDLLTFRMGLGMVMAQPGEYPIQRALDEAGLSPGLLVGPIEPDEWMKRLGDLPLVHQPGEKWMYHTGSDVLGVLMTRATGRPLEELLKERLFEPLGMKDTGFHVPADKLDRLTASYRPDPGTGALVLDDDPRQTRWGRPPIFPSAGGGLVSTADDLLAFCTMMLNRGRYGGERILSRPSVELMTTDQLTEEQKAENTVFFGGGSGWGLGVNVITRRNDLSAVPGRFGWNGGTGTSVYTDPAEELIGILLTQRYMTSPMPPAVFRDFWTCAYQAIDD
ncbi:CubicO group peptidase, beta-lactamase class C family [Streptosporangium subroseum]|uniref:CubicO group peptidase, beta-lactamase class C family n=1 Tax=Streptosporangium subroseum TaxID=106412 RepID=A0A239ACU1_9ACTN|nr:serine hydrolase domain-containing protein [Streptosporangium subroseum]SNR93467.1 CubicO group peptidase, beta-lactamase class C family [Streptosporangium subroseum]